MPVTYTQALTQLRRQLGSRFHLTKRAALGDSEQSFEQAFSSLVHAYLSERAPKLLQYELGFQLLEKNDNGTRAVGIVAFKLGDHYLYAPTFFLNGDLKGRELLYLKNQDLFVPLQDSWVSYLLGRKPLSLGKGVDRNLSHLGVQGPTLYQLARSPMKYAQVNDWRTQALAEVARLVTTRPNSQGTFDLAPFLKSAGAWALRGVLTLCQAQPQLLGQFDRYHPGLLEEVARVCRPAEKSASVFRQWAMGDMPAEHYERVKLDEPVYGNAVFIDVGRAGKPRKRQSLLDMMRNGQCKSATKAAGKSKAKVIVWTEGGPDERQLTYDEKAALLKARYVVRDDRDETEVAHAYDVATELQLVNPSATGVYEVLIRPDEFRRCLVLLSPYSQEGRHTFCTVVDLENKRWINIHPSRVWTRASMGKEDFSSWFDQQKEVSDAPGALVVLLTRSGQATVPLEIVEKAGSATSKDYSGVWETRFYNFAWEGQPYYGRDLERWNFRHDPPAHLRHSRVRFTGKSGAKITRHEGGELWVPADIKFLILKPAKPPKSDKEQGFYCSAPPSCYDRSDPAPLEPGSLADIQLWLHGHTYPLKVMRKGKDFALTSRELRGALQTKEAALRDLVVTHQLREKVALGLLDRATERGQAECAILPPNQEKRAAANLIDGAPNAPAFPEAPQQYDPMTRGRVPAQVPTEWALPIQDLLSNLGRRETYDLLAPDQDTIRAVNEAAETGEKEVFDTAVLGGLLKSVRDDTVIDRFLPDVMKGMNALGRLLFSYYWHQDQFAERYGKGDLQPIEDGLRNAFETTGQILLDLKARKMNAALDEGMSADNHDAEDVANV